MDFAQEEKTVIFLGDPHLPEMAISGSSLCKLVHRQEISYICHMVLGFQIIYLSHVITTEVFKPDLDKISAVIN